MDKVRAVTLGSRVAGFCNQIIDLDTNCPRDDSRQIAHSAKIEGFIQNENCWMVGACRQKHTLDPVPNKGGQGSEEWIQDGSR